MIKRIFPSKFWQQLAPDPAGFNPDKLSIIDNWLSDQSFEKSYRIVIIRYGYLVAEWNHKVNRDEHIKLASAAKSVFSCILGKAIEEGRIGSADDLLADYYPEAFDVPEGFGPKPGRYAFEKDRNITLRQLITNTSGYMKPGEEPGKVFHYQTYGMNILTHAIAKTYGLYDITKPVHSPGLKVLVDRMIKEPIGAQWSYYLANFDLHPDAKINIFGYYDGVAASALDMARLGWLWCNWGQWANAQLIPETWLRQAVRTADNIKENSPIEKWQYGHGFWCNDHQQLFPGLPRNSFAAQGAGSQQIWVCPSLDLVVVQSPGVYEKDKENAKGLLKFVMDSIIH
jgi:CubicO group peptidase (beta-lactamase class C family)